ncbi:MAG: hypothetical protein AN485_24685 [Anabaena sp. MDT14b]|nr:MAG: hypothetical protein AN485_24685 [Anabaena sp. MDT14b]
MIAKYNAELPDNLGECGELLRRVLSGVEVILTQDGDRKSVVEGMSEETGAAARLKRKQYIATR